MRSPTIVLWAALVGMFLLWPSNVSCEETRVLTPYSGQRNDDALLTPATMGDKRFSITCRFTEQTIKKGTLPTRQTGLVHVVVVFDAEKGQAIRNIGCVKLEVRESDRTLLLVPLQTSSHPRPTGVASLQFWIRKELLGKASLVLTDARQGSWPSFHVDLYSFYSSKKR